MSGTGRTIVFSVVALVGLVLLVGAGLVLWVDPNAHKARLEAAASRATGLEVGIAGRLRLRLSPGVHLVLQDVHLRNRGTEIVRADEATVGVGLMSLLGADVQIHSIVLNRAVLTIERDRDGRFNFQRRPAAGQAFPARDLPDVTLSDATITYADQRFGKGFEASDCQVAVRALRRAGGQHANPIRALTFTADAACSTARKANLSVSDLKLSVDARAGVVEIKPMTARMFGAPGSGRAHADFSGAVPAYQVAFALPQFSVDGLLEAMALKRVAAGRMDLVADLAMQGRTAKDMQHTMKGKVSLRGKGLTFNGGDLDQRFARFESSQNFNLVDVGAVLLAGPLGLVVTKGYDFATIAQSGEGSSEIRTLVSDWRVERGVARAEDVAMATAENRVALQGGIDWANDRFDEVTIALVDAKGCVKVQQKIRGTLQKPVVEKPGLLGSLAGPAVRLLKKGSELLGGGGPCEVFYAGSVAAPK